MNWFPLLIGLVLCCAAPTSHLCAASKTERVEAYLGSYRYEYDKPLGTVKFIFQRAVLTREGNGKKSYKQLLIGQRGFTNTDNAGDLLAIQVVHKGDALTIYPEPAGKNKTRVKQKPTPVPMAPEALVEAPAPPKPRPSRAAPVQLVNEPPQPVTAAAAPDPVRPRPLFGQAEPRPQLSMPDSATLAQNLEGAKVTVSSWKSRLWQSAQPVWEFVMWTFNSLIVLLICFGGLCRYVAKTAAAESKITPKGRVVVGRWIVGAHQNASGMLLIITWVIAIFFLIDVFMWLIYLDLPVWLLVVIWFPVLWFAEKLTGWIVPNLRGDDSRVA